jgi:glycerophosphoryl diester phosphodiesterase
MWNNLLAPVIVAHRGDKACAPENTISAFKQAADKGADAVEFDVKLTSDGRVIVIHDQTVNRTTNGSGNVARLSFAELQELEAGVQFPGKFLGEKIPTLDEVFEAVGKRLYMNVELTNYSTPTDSLIPKVVDLVKKHGVQSRVLFSSFFAQNLHKARQLLPDVPSGLLTFPGRLGWWGRAFGWRGDYTAMHPNYRDVNLELVARVHAAGKKVNTWTVTTKADINKMYELGVDGIITGNLELTLRLLGRIK